MRKYFVHELKKNVPIFLLITVLLTLWTVILPASGFDAQYFVRFSLYRLANAMGVVACLLPFWLFRYKMQKRTVDLIYSLPLSRTKILTVRFFVGLLLLVVPYAFTFLVGLIANYFFALRHTLFPLWYLPYFFLSLLPIYGLFATVSFLFTRANNFLDGIVGAFFGSLTLFCAVCAFYPFIGSGYDFLHGIYGELIIPNFYLPYYPLSSITSYFQSLVLSNCTTPLIDFSSQNNIQLSVNTIVSWSLYAVEAVAATIGLFLSEKKYKAELCTQKSESLFTYRIPLPVCFFTAFLFCTRYLIDTLWLLLLSAVIFYLLLALWERTFRIGKRSRRILIWTTVAGTVAGFATGMFL